MIHPTAIVGRTATVPEDCEIGPYSILEEGVALGPGCRLGAHVVLRQGTLLGEGVVVHAGAVIGGEPQDLAFDRSIPSGVTIGDQVVIREAVTINRSTRAGGQTVVGPRCYLMATSHVAHDCNLAERVVLANATLLAGFVAVGKYTFIGGGAGVHQFCRIGESVMLGGNASISLDLPPFTIAADRNRLSGLNLVGLRRRGFAAEVVADLKRAFAAVYRSGGNLRQAAATALEGNLAVTPEGISFLRFFAEGKRGFARPERGEA
jgi:UDP-N-acetylglucosamine acyltransferase